MPTVAFALLLLQVPPDVTSLKLVADPAHTFAFPEIDNGTAFTVTGFVIIQPVLNI